MTNSERYSTSAVSISYFDPFDIFESIKEQFLEVFPLRNIHWKAVNGSLRTISEIPVDLITESTTFENEDQDIRLFIRFVVVNCISTDDYRAKVRPLIRQWLPAPENDTWRKDVTRSPLPVILLYANSEVVDFKLFKSTSLIDKVAKDFPEVKTLELKSVYKSPREKEEFWGQMSQHLKSCVLDVFQSRLMYYQTQLKDAMSSSNLTQEILFRENLLELYMALNMLEEAKNELEELRECLDNKLINELPRGELEVPFQFPQNKIEQLRLGETLIAEQLTKYKADKYFFIKEFQIIMTDNTNSPNYLQLYKIIRQFLCLTSSFVKERGFLEFKFSFLDCCLLHLLERPQAALKQLTAELLLKKRDCWVQGVLGCTNYALIGKAFPSTDVNYSFGSFENTYDSEEVFHKTYTKYTREIIILLSQCDGARQRTIDILSIEIGLLHYQRKEFEKAVTLFLSCYEYYMQTKWDLIGVEILKVFVDSLVQCPGLTQLKIDEELVPASVILSNAYLNILRISDDVKEKGEWWLKINDLHQYSPTDLVYATDGLFQINHGEYVYSSMSNTLEIDVTIQDNKIPEDIAVDSMTLLLKRSDDVFMKFQQKNVVLSKGTTICPLRAVELCYGKFKAVSVEINVGSITFVKEYLDEDASELLVEPIYDPAGIAIKIQQASKLDLGEYALQVSCDNFDQLHSSNIMIMVENDGLNSPYPASFTEDAQTSSKHISKVAESCIVPYYLKETVTSFKVKARFSFTRADSETEFSETRSFDINCCLPVSVSVEDIFRKGMFIFKFLLNSSTSDRPVVLHSTRLLPPPDSNHYNISGHFKPESSLCLSANLNEYCLNCYQITTENCFTPIDCFRLEISYNTLKEQLDKLVTDAVLVQGNVEWYRKFEPWKYVWELIILPLLRFDYDAFQESMTILLSPDSLNFDHLNKLLRRLSIPDDVNQAIINCVLRLTKGTQLTNIDVNAYTKNLTARKLTVPVELPKFEQLFYVQLSVEEGCDFAVGVPAAFSIKIKSINGEWGHKGLAGKFLFEIISSNEWLVHGRKRMLITSEVTEVSLHIIPLKRGYLNFPKVEIMNVDTEETSRIDNANSYDTVLVF